MSAKATGLVWDLECPKEYNGIAFKPSHKYTLVAYADHADHNGKSIYPAVATVAKKTGLDERTVQRLTKDLEAIGFLVRDGQGPKGTNRWQLPYSDGGDKLTPCQPVGGDESEDSLGDIPSGDIPSGDKLTSESNNPEPNTINTNKEPILKVIASLAPSVFGNDLTKWWEVRRRLEEKDVSIAGDPEQKPNPEKPMRIVIGGLSAKPKGGQFTEAEIWEDRFYRSFANLGLEIKFLAESAYCLMQAEEA